ncbi:MAG: DinB family protein [Bacteroidota bacterium]
MTYSPNDGFPYYLDLMEEKNLDTLFAARFTESIIEQLDDEKAQHRYAPNKWSIKEVIGHITDHERIKMHRAFLLSRKMPVQLWGYDQDKLIFNSRFDVLPLTQIRQDYLNVRQASISLIESFSADQLDIQGTANRHIVSLADFIRTVIGHERHHVRILEERYLN